MTHYFITGGAGFIGSHLIERLISFGHVTIYDNLSAGKYENIARFVDSKQATFICGDVLNQDVLTAAMRNHDMVFHLSASSDIMTGRENTCRDLQQGTIATSNVLNAMCANNIAKIMYSSSGTVYGNFSSPCVEH